MLDVPRSGDGWYITGNSNDWYDTNAVVQLTAIPSNSFAKAFSHWTGQTNTTSNPLNLPMSIAWTNLTPVFTDRTYTWTINSPYIGVDGFTITPGTTNWPYGTIETNTLNKTIINLEPGKRAVYKGYQTQEGN